MSIVSNHFPESITAGYEEFDSADYAWGRDLGQEREMSEDQRIDMAVLVAVKEKREADIERLIGADRDVLQVIGSSGHVAAVELRKLVVLEEALGPFPPF
jgi:hypothetical protein